MTLFLFVPLEGIENHLARELENFFVIAKNKDGPDRFSLTSLIGELDGQVEDRLKDLRLNDFGDFCQSLSCNNLRFLSGIDDLNEVDEALI